jgi:uncharacterized protein
MDCVWDETKAASNLVKHGVSFEDACIAVNDPARLEWFDDRFDYEEPRLCVIGLSPRSMLFVVVIEGASACRILSARRATRLEEQAYYARFG